MRCWTTAFGESTLVLRFPSIVGTAVAAGALALQGRKLYDTPAGVAAGLLAVRERGTPPAEVTGGG